jgi:hypothetical protein
MVYTNGRHDLTDYQNSVNKITLLRQVDGRKDDVSPLQLRLNPRPCRDKESITSSKKHSQ